MEILLWPPQIIPTCQCLRSMVPSAQERGHEWQLQSTTIQKSRARVPLISQHSYAVTAHLDAPSRSTGKLLEPTEKVKGVEENQHTKINGVPPHYSSKKRDEAEAATSVDFSCCLMTSVWPAENPNSEGYGAGAAKSLVQWGKGGIKYLSLSPLRGKNVGSNETK